MLDRLGVKTKIFLLTIVPVSTLAVLALSAVLHGRAAVSDARKVEVLAGVAVRAGELAHEIQRERDLSAAYLASGGALNASELEAQQRETDRILAALERLVSEAGVEGRTADVLARLTRDLARLDELRQAVRSGQVTARVAIDDYSELAAELFSAMSHLAGVGGDGAVVARISAYRLILEAKELAGKERALLHAALDAGRFADPEEFVAFASAVAAQNTLLRRFKDQAAEVDLRRYDNAMTDPAVGEVERMRRAALAGMGAEGLGVDPRAWWSAATRRIDLLETVAHGAAAEVQQTAASLATEAYSSFVGQTALAVSTLLGTLLLGYL